jgi:uncharacterized protein (TIGR03067 family)
MRPLSVLALAAGLLVAADDPAKEKDALAAFQGTWKAVDLERNGEKTPEDERPFQELVIDGKTFTYKIGDVAHRGTFTIDPSKSPRAIDRTHEDGEFQGKTLKGVYKIEGDDFAALRRNRL